MKRGRLVSIALFLLVPASALSASVGTTFGTAQKWGPNGNGTLPHEDDLRWLDFHDAQVTADAAAGIYSARFGVMLRRLDGQDYVITGYMLPIDTGLETRHFVLTRRSANCPFCPPNEPTEAIEVFSQQFMKPTQAPITVEGKLHLVANSAQGLFFRLDSAKIW